MIVTAFNGTRFYADKCLFSSWVRCYSFFLHGEDLGLWNESEILSIYPDSY